MKSREIAKKPVFAAYFRHFRSEKYVFRKSVFCHILNIAILHQCAKFNEKTNEPISRKACDRRRDGRRDKG